MEEEDISVVWTIGIFLVLFSLPFSGILIGNPANPWDFVFFIGTLVFVLATFIMNYFYEKKKS